MKKEIWKKIIGYPNYEISNRGRIKSNNYRSKNKILKDRINLGYNNVVLYENKVSKRFRISRLVAINFIPNPFNLPIVNHIDLNKLNNNVENLEWCNQSYNIKHDFKKGNRSLKGEKNTQAKLTEKIVKEIRKSNKTQNEIALKYGVHQTTIHLIKSNKRWNFI